MPLSLQFFTDERYKYHFNVDNAYSAELNISNVNSVPVLCFYNFTNVYISVFVYNAIILPCCAKASHISIVLHEFVLFSATGNNAVINAGGKHHNFHLEHHLPIPAKSRNSLRNSSNTE